MQLSANYYITVDEVHDVCMYIEYIESSSSLGTITCKLADVEYKNNIHISQTILMTHYPFAINLHLIQ